MSQISAEMETLQKRSMKNNIPANPTPTTSGLVESAVDQITDLIKEQSSSSSVRPDSSSKFQTLSLTVPKPFVYHVELNRP